MFSLEYCKHNLGRNEEIIFHWGMCYHQRRKILNGSLNTVEYFNSFPGLKHPHHGYQFLMDDFIKTYSSDTGDNLYKNWPLLRPTLLKLMQEDKIKPKFNDIGKKYSVFQFVWNYIIAFSCVDLDVIFNFALIFPSTTLRGKKSYRPSKLEVQNSFIIYVPVSILIFTTYNPNMWSDVIADISFTYMLFLLSVR